MPFAEFTPGYSGSELFEQSATNRTLMQRAQQIQIDKAKLELEKQQVASGLAVNAQNIEASRAHVAEINTQIKGQELDNTLKAATSKFTIGAMDAAGKLFGFDTAAGAPANAPETSPFAQDIAKLYAAPTATASDIYRFKNQLAVINSKYGTLAQVHPAAKLMFEQALAPVTAMLTNAQGVLQGQAFSTANRLRTPLTQVKDQPGLDAFLATQGEDHNVAMLDEKYATEFLATAKDVRDKAAALANETAMKKLTLENERAMNATKSTVADPLYSGTAPTPEAAQKVRDQLAIYRPTVDALDGLDRILSMVQKDPKMALSPALRGEAQIVQQQLVSSIGRMQVGGVLSDSEATTMKGLVADPTKILSLSSTNAAKFAMLRHENQVRMDAVAIANGVGKQNAAPVTPEELQKRVRDEMRARLNKH